MKATQQQVWEPVVAHEPSKSGVRVVRDDRHLPAREESMPVTVVRYQPQSSRTASPVRMLSKSPSRVVSPSSSRGYSPVASHREMTRRHASSPMLAYPGSTSRARETHKRTAQDRSLSRRQVKVPVECAGQPRDDMRADMMRLQAELSTLRREKEKSQQGLQQELMAAHAELGALRAEQPNKGEVARLRKELEQARAGPQQDILQAECRAAQNELQKVQLAKQSQQQELREELFRTRMEMDALLAAKDRKQTELQEELQRAHAEFASLRSRQEAQRDVNEELRQMHSGQEALNARLREQGDARRCVQEELLRVREQFDSDRFSHEKQKQQLQEELSRTRVALDAVSTEKQKQLLLMQDELMRVRTELSSLLANQSRQNESQAELTSVRMTEREALLDKLKRQDEELQRLSEERDSLLMNIKSQEMFLKQNDPSSELLERVQRQDEELNRTTAERNALMHKLRRHEDAQDEILRTCSEVEQMHLKAIQKQEELKSELERVHMERNSHFSASQSLRLDLPNEGSPVMLGRIIPDVDGTPGARKSSYILTIEPSLLASEHARLSRGGC
mmetsp:Transcript_29527/g.57946  ORF Transcript_29527/g.57946 Transcript_29527/m.57946 type:complete len:565 (+) Transcript_29527:87-1781(+)